MLLAIAAAGLFLAQAEPQAASSAQAATPATKSTDTAKPKQICRSETPTGSNFAKRVCHTAEEWKQITAAAKADTEALRSCQNGQGC